MAFECPKVGCKGVVKKPVKYGESSWNCPECGEDWFIMNLPQPKIGNKRKEPEKMVEVKEKRKPITREDAERSVKKVMADRREGK